MSNVRNQFTTYFPRGACLSDIGVLNVNAEMVYTLDRESIISHFLEMPHRILL